MQQFSFTHNTYADEDPFLKGFLGLSLCPSAEAQRNASNYEADVVYLLRKLYAKFVSSRVLIRIGQYQNKKVIIRPRPIPDPDPTQLWDDKEVRLYGADTVPSNSSDAAPKGTEWKPVVPGKEPWQVKDKIVGTGLGSDAQILFNPGIMRTGRAPHLVRLDYPTGLWRMN
jgi:hypothetical protein